MEDGTTEEGNSYNIFQIQKNANQKKESESPIVFSGIPPSIMVPAVLFLPQLLTHASLLIFRSTERRAATEHNSTRPWPIPGRRRTTEKQKQHSVHTYPQ